LNFENEAEEYFYDREQVEKIKDIKIKLRKIISLIKEDLTKNKDGSIYHFNLGENFQSSFSNIQP
jgi:hypothetical protein